MRQPSYWAAIENGMPIRPFLAGQAFEPEIIREMSLALEIVAHLGMQASKPGTVGRLSWRPGAECPNSPLYVF